MDINVTKENPSAPDRQRPLAWDLPGKRRPRGVSVRGAKSIGERQTLCVRLGAVESDVCASERMPYRWLILLSAGVIEGIPCGISSRGPCWVYNRWTFFVTNENQGI